MTEVLGKTIHSRANFDRASQEAFYPHSVLHPQIFLEMAQTTPSSLSNYESILNEEETHLFVIGWCFGLVACASRRLICACPSLRTQASARPRNANYSNFGKTDLFNLLGCASMSKSSRFSPLWYYLLSCLSAHLRRIKTWWSCDQVKELTQTSFFTFGKYSYTPHSDCDEISASLGVMEERIQ